MSNSSVHGAAWSWPGCQAVIPDAGVSRIWLVQPVCQRPVAVNPAVATGRDHAWLVALCASLVMQLFPSDDVHTNVLDA